MGRSISPLQNSTVLRIMHVCICRADLFVNSLPQEILPAGQKSQNHNELVGIGSAAVGAGVAWDGGRMDGCAARPQDAERSEFNWRNRYEG